MKRAVIAIMILTLLSKVIGFLRDVVLANYYGVSNVSDAFFIALTIPTVLFGFVASAISTGYIPIYSQVEKDHGTTFGNLFTTRLLIWLAAAASIVVVMGVIFTEPLVRLFASGFDAETTALAVSFTRITLLGIYLSACIRVLSAFLNMKKLFIVPTLLGLPLNIVLITAIILSHYTEFILLLAYGQVAALVIQLAILLVFARRKGLKFSRSFAIRDPHMKMLLLMALPVTIGSMVHQVNKLVDRTLASQVVEGGISALSYANTFTTAVQGILVVSISTVLFPAFAKYAVAENFVRLKSSLEAAAISISALLIPATVGILIFAEPIIRLLFERGAFDESAVVLTTGTLFFYAIGMVGYGLREIYSRAFYALKDTRTPMINGVIAMVINIVLNFILVGYMGINGLALATSIAAIITTVLLIASLQRKMGNIISFHLILTFGKIVLASISMAAVSYVSFNHLQNAIGLSLLLSLTLAVTIGILIYGVAVIVLRVKEVLDLLQVVGNKVLRK